MRPTFVTSLTSRDRGECCSMAEWEEPHPGQRVSIPQAASSREHISEHPHGVTGVCGEVTITETSTTDPSRSRMPRLRPPHRYRWRFRQVLSIPLPTPITSDRHHEALAAVIQTRSNVAGANNSASTPTRPASIVSCPPMMQSGPVFEEVTEAQGGVLRRRSDSIETPSPSALSILRLSMVDSSHPLGIQLCGKPEINDADTDLTFGDRCRVITPNGDIYGWEAAFDKRKEVSNQP